METSFLFLQLSTVVIDLLQNLLMSLCSFIDVEASRQDCRALKEIRFIMINSSRQSREAILIMNSGVRD